MQIKLSELRLPTHDLRVTIDADALDELADSLRDQGQLQAIGVRIAGENEYEVVFGARRTRAAKSLGWETIRAEILDEASAETNAAAKLIENVQREALTPIEEGYGLIALIADGETDIRYLQRQTGKSREWIKNRLSLIDLPEDIQSHIQTGELGIAAAKYLGAIDNPEVRATYVKHAIDNGCTADQAKIWAAGAQYAETGLTTMQLNEAELERMNTEPQVVDQKYNCFRCAQVKTWRQINTLVLCGPCQEHIANARELRSLIETRETTTPSAAPS